jgi:uncharacterized membrane protein YphA (DoxX/SURF4 family)
MKSLLKVARDTLLRLRHPLAALKDTFFRAVSPLDLAILRVVVYGYVCYWSWGRTYAWSEWAAQAQTVGVYRLLGIASDPTLNLIQRVGQWSALCCALGLAFRPAALLCALTVPYVIGIGNNFGKVDHDTNLLAISLLVLCFSRAGDFASIDGWLRQRRAPAALPASAEYRWPIAALWLLVAGMYCAAGVSKLVHTGWSWALSDNLQLLFLRHQVTHHPPTQLGVTLAQYPHLCRRLGLASLLTELLCPLLLLGGPWGLLGVILMALQFGIYLTLGVSFDAMVPVFAAFIPWHSMFTLAAVGLGKRTQRVANSDMPQA